VLAGAYEDKFAGGLRPSAFLRIRLRRLWPLIGLGTIAGALSLLAIVPPSALIIPTLMGLLLIPGFGSQLPLYPLNAPQWSLAWEIVANFLHGFVLWRLGARALLSLAASCAVGLWITVPLNGSVNAGAVDNLRWMAGLRVGFSYTAGVLLARVLQPGLHGEFAGPFWILALALPVLTSIGLQFLPSNEVAGDIAMVLIAIPAMLWFAICCRVPGRYSRLLQTVGGLSFPIYALHVPIITLVSERFGGIQGGIIAAGAVGLAAWSVAQYAVLLGPIPSRRAAKPALF
jgi:peptidoglycan/LPS O-acetylase OafA/YrhL